MAQRKQLHKKQLAVLEDLFAGELDAQQVLDKHKVNTNTLNRWLTNSVFAVEFDRRMEWLNRQSELIIARYKSLAAAQLVRLTESDKEETARKACLDIISLPTLSTQKLQAPTESQTANTQQTNQLPPQTISRLLAALAKEREEKEEKGEK